MKKGEIILTKKVFVAIYDRDLKVEMKKCPLTEDGSKIKIKKGGKGHWSPEFDNESYLEFPSRFGTKRVYVVRKHANKCVSFKDPTTTVYGPDPDVVIEAAEGAIRKSMKQEEQDTPFILYIMLALIAIVFLKVMGIIA